MFRFARLIATFFLIGMALPAAAAEDVRVDIGRHPGFTRLVFNWTAPTGYTINRIGPNARVQFDKAGQIDADRLASMLPDPSYGARVSGGAGAALTVDLTIPQAAYLRHFAADSRIIVDILELSKVDVLQDGGMLAGAMAAEGGTPPVVQTIAPSGEILTVPAMIGTKVVVSPQGPPLITEEDGAAAGAPAQAIPTAAPATPRTGYTPLRHYDPTASGLPRSLLLYDRKTRTGKPEGS